MATPIKKKVQASAVHPAVRLSSVPLETAISSVHALADEYDAVLGEITKKMLCPQNVMRLAYRSSDLVSEAGRFTKAFDKFALEHRTGAGGFAHQADAGSPLIVVGFPGKGGGISPKWKEEALLLAEQVSTLKGETFDAKQFEEAIRRKYKAGELTVSVRLDEAG